MDDTNKHFSRSLGPCTLWGLGVGYVISGMYFGWNLGLPAGGTLGFGIALFFISIMYIAFTFGYCELACAIPKAGGILDYATHALGPYVGFIAGIAQLIEFVFAPPAIAAAIGAYFTLFVPHINPLLISISAYLLFTGINIYGVKLAAAFELTVTIIAVIGLLIFIGTTLPHFEYQNLMRNALPHGIPGIFAALPFAIWFFLGIEGVANMAEETCNPQQNILLGFGSSMLTVLLLCVLTFLCAVGVGGWEAISYSSHGLQKMVLSNSPLPLALAQIVSQQHILYKLIVFIGLAGLIASFHGLILAGGRVTFELGRIGYMPKIVGRIHNRLKTPAVALLANMIVGILALLTGKTGEIITVAAFGALSVYLFSMVTLLKLRRSEPELHRPFRLPLYPFAPITALLIAFLSLIFMSLYHLELAAVYFILLLVALTYFQYFVKKNLVFHCNKEQDPSLRSG